MVCQCTHCDEQSLWHLGKMIVPDKSGIQPPNPDLRDDIQDDYREAATIVTRSPRGAAALLRLSVQKLCKQLGESGKHLDKDIASLVKKGLPSRIQKALDIVRVSGNNAVHPGRIDFKDDQETATALFGLVNSIADAMITQEKKTDELYQNLPECKRKRIAERDRNA